MKERHLFGSANEVEVVAVVGEVGANVIVDATREARTRWVGVQEWLCRSRHSLLLSSKQRLE
jgi:hypothetical protein